LFGGTDWSNFPISFPPSREQARATLGGEFPKHAYFR
jgi:hypothetical protein